MDSEAPYNEGGRTLVELTLELYRLHGLLCAEGDRLGSEIRVSAAQWKLLGALALAKHPQTVSQIARRMGLTRQSVQRVVDVLTERQYVERLDNPEHRRAYLLSLTSKGRKAFQRLDHIEASWANEIAAGIPPRNLERATRTLREIRG